MNNETPMLFPQDPEKFLNKIREIIRAEINGNNVTYSVPGLIQKPLYKVHEVCKILQISRQTLHTWVKEGVLPQYKIKSRSFFLWTDIENLLHRAS